MMKKMLLMVVAMTTIMSAKAQKIEVVDQEGVGIPLVTVLTEDGNIIGTTNLNGVLNDIKGAERLLVTHVAYKPQLITVALLKDGRITMEDQDYGLREIVVMPKPYIYVETYYRAYAFINDPCASIRQVLCPMPTMSRLIRCIWAAPITVAVISAPVWELR